MVTPYTPSQVYIDEFNPQDYFQTYYAPGEFEEWRHFVLKTLHETFAPGRVEGDLLLDFGAGPTIYHLLSACEVFKNIITSDFLEQNRKELHKWLKKDPNALNWKPIVKFVCDLEGKSDNLEEKEDKLRKKVTKVVKCDALKKNPFEGEDIPKADCLLTCLCLEGPCKDVASFTNVIKNLKDFIKPGGHFIIMGVLNCSFYYIGKKLFFSLSLTKEDLERAFKEAGYEIEELKIIPRNDKSRMDISGNDGYYFLHARKPHK